VALDSGPVLIIGFVFFAVLVLIVAVYAGQRRR
jgi:hypothetical protein